MRVAVIGGGAAGAAAAIAAAENGASVVVLERNRRPLKKLCVTGNGRGNLFNTGAPRYEGDPAFAREVLQRLPPDFSPAFWDSLGVSLALEEEGRAYPASFQASSAADALLLRMEELGVSLRRGVRVVSLRPDGDGFTLEAVESVYADDRSKKNGKLKKGELLEERPFSLRADRAVLACGGAAAPVHGSDGSAYSLLTALGHTLIPPRPALCPLLTETPWTDALCGQRVKARLRLLDAQGKTLKECSGELLFARDGVSGVVAMQLARYVQPGCMLEIDLAQALTGSPDGATSIWLERRLHALGSRPLRSLLVGAASPALAEALFRRAGLKGPERPAASLSPGESAALLTAVCGFSVAVKGVRGFDAAQVTAGGISTAEFFPATLESRLIPDLYAAGEMLDVDGDCGGFNLMFAFASGWLAGKSCAGA